MSSLEERLAPLPIPMAAGSMVGSLVPYVDSTVLSRHESGRRRAGE